MVPASPLGMETSGRNHRHTGSRGMSLTAPEVTGCAAALASSSPVHYCCFFCNQQSSVCLESVSKKLKKDISDERGYQRNFKIGSCKNISDCPSYTVLLPHA